MFSSARSAYSKREPGLINYVLYIRVKAMHVLNLRTPVVSNYVASAMLSKASRATLVQPLRRAYAAS